MKIIDRGTVFKGIPGTNMSCNYIPSVAVLSNGDIMVCHRTGSGKISPDGQIALEISKNGGKEWSEPVLPFSNIFEGVKGSLWSAYPIELQDGKIMCTVFWIDRETYKDKEYLNVETLGILPVKTLIAESLDYGRTWSGFRELDPSPFDCPLPVMNSIYKLHGGVLACPFEKYKSYNDKEPWKQAAVMKFSYDMGQTWPDYSIAAEDKNHRYWYNDQRGTVLKNNTIINFYSVYDSYKSEYNNIHMNQSTDGGKTWSLPRDTGIPGMPSQPVEMDNGHVLLANADQLKTQSIGLWISKDGGISWNTEEPLVLYPDSHLDCQVDTALDQKDYNNWKHWTYGRPQTVLLPDGNVFVVYYAGSEKCTDIYYARIEV